MRFKAFADMLAKPSFALAASAFERRHSHELTHLIGNLGLHQFDKADDVLAFDPRLAADLHEGQKLSGGFVRALQGFAAHMGSTQVLDWLERHELRMETREMGREPSSMHPIALAIEDDNREILAWYHDREGKEAFAEELPSRVSPVAKAISNHGLFFWMLEREPSLVNEPFYPADWADGPPITIDEYIALKDDSTTNLSDQFRAFRAAQAARQALDELNPTHGVAP